MLRPTAKPFISQAPSATLALNEQALINRGTVEPAATISVEYLEAPATPEEVKAATVIQVAYRRVLRRRAGPPPKVERVKWWYDQCANAQIHLQGPKAYSKYFLGPLVHVLIWADAMVCLLKNRRDRVKKKFRPAEHTQIEDLMERLAVCK